MSSFDLILSLEFLLKIVQFVTIPTEDLAAPKPAVGSSSSSGAALKTINKCKLN